MDKINFCGTVYEMSKFAQEYCEGDMETAQAVAEKLVSQGRASWVRQDVHAKENKQLLKALVQETIVEQADLHDEYDAQAKAFRQQQAREGRLTYKGIELAFPHLGKAQEFQLWVTQELNLESQIVIKGAQCILQVFNLTDREMNAINRNYKADKTIQSVVHGVDKVASSATSAVDYTAKKVIAPTVQVGAKAGVSILKTLAVTGAKATGTIVSSLAFGTKQCAKEIATDADVLRASREILEVKDSAMRAVKSKSNSVSSGIRIMD